MKPPLPTAPSTKFARYAAASVAALGAAAAAEAQFAGDYSLEGPAANTFNDPANLSTFGQWTFDLSSGHTVVTTSAGSSLDLTVDSFIGFGAGLIFTAVAANDGNVSFDYSSVLSGAGGGSFRYGTNGNYSTPAAFGTDSGPITFAVSSGDVFGFRLQVAYAYNTILQVAITNFSAPLAAVPEAGTTSLLAGIAALGFVGLMANRKLRERAAAPTAA